MSSERDPRRAIDAKYERLKHGKVRFIELSSETVLEPQPIGSPQEVEILIIKINKGQISFYLFLAAFLILVFALSFIFA